MFDPSSQPVDTYPDFCSIKQQKVYLLLLPLNGMQPDELLMRSNNRSLLALTNWKTLDCIKIAAREMWNLNGEVTTDWHVDRSVRVPSWTGASEIAQ